MTKRLVCSICGHPLIELPWSKTGEERMYILTCDNSGCRCFRTPVATIKRLEVRTAVRKVRLRRQRGTLLGGIIHPKGVKGGEVNKQPQSHDR